MAPPRPSPKKQRIKKRAPKGKPQKGSKRPLDDDNKPPAKRAKTRRTPDDEDTPPFWKSQFRSKPVKLKSLWRLATDVPLDIIHEIFCYLDLDDILRLSRTSKNLRRILMSKNSEFVWRTARLNVKDLPYRPNDLNEPQYARLLCDRYCYLCQRKDCDNVLWTFRARVCQRCLTSLPLYNRNYLCKQPEAYRDLGILPSERTVTGRSTRLLGSNKWAKRFREEFEVLETQNERDEWISRKEKEHEDLKKHAELCEKWHQSVLLERDRDPEQERMDDIVERLIYESEFELVDEANIMIQYNERKFTSHRLVKQPTDLTDDSWSRIKTRIKELLSNHRAKRLALWAECEWTASWSSYPYPRTLR